jgi:hypothetical protein
MKIKNISRLFNLDNYYPLLIKKSRTIILEAIEDFPAIPLPLSVRAGGGMSLLF